MNCNQKKRGLFTALLLLLTLSVLGQPKNLEVSSGSYYKKPDSGLRYFGRNSFCISARHESFLNDVFYQYSEQKDIKTQIGVEISYSTILFSPIALEVTGFYSSFNIEPLTKKGESSYVTHMGVECFVNAFFLPYVGKISNYLAPYAGIGYQTSSLKWGDDTSAGTGSAMIKFGTNIRMSRSLLLHAEYKQSLPKSSNKLFRALALGIGYNF